MFGWLRKPKAKDTCKTCVERVSELGALERQGLLLGLLIEEAQEGYLYEPTWLVGSRLPVFRRVPLRDPQLSRSDHEVRPRRRRGPATLGDSSLPA